MLTTPPPGFTTNFVNQQSNQLLGKPNTPAVGKPAPALMAAKSTPALSPNPMMAMPPQLRQLVQLLQGHR